MEFKFIIIVKLLLETNYRKEFWEYLYCMKYVDCKCFVFISNSKSMERELIVPSLVINKLL